MKILLAPPPAPPLPMNTTPERKRAFLDRIREIESRGSSHSLIDLTNQVNALRAEGIKDPAVWAAFVIREYRR